MKRPRSSTDNMIHQTLYLLPLPISEHADDLPPATLKAFQQCTAFVCERVRTFRRWVKYLNHPLAIDDMTLIEMEKHDPIAGMAEMDQLKKDHQYIGIVSEAGCPGIADPGYRYATWAHGHDMTVRSFSGPNSLLLALMNSGFSGQNFAFHGYLSAKKNLLAKDLQQLERESTQMERAQIFIEAPYRNRQILEVAFATLSPSTRFHISVDLRTEQEWSRTLSIADWKKSSLPDLHKRPAVFILNA